MLPLALLALLSSSPLVSAQGNVSFFDPTSNGGSFLSTVSNNLGEPMNVIISGASSPQVLTPTGLLTYIQAIGFSTECLNMHSRAPFTANLGDGAGARNQSVEFREAFGDPFLGTCIELFLGGNHLRVFGPQVGSGALFLATSIEAGLFQNHTVVPNGYDIGRDAIVRMAIGTKQFNGTTFNTTVQNLTGVMPSGSNGVNHGIAIDGNAVLLTVTIA
ncbi:hypothetical protein PsYK624_110740 [Phanerochaete sordida]|uniref:Secreted protein n=1 Tax=Phanerochaete sordida TaxID=48140 RepID=A0A9P3GH99_9APHY|nr:hypothetical protein PsYK624_110740 [Phanerochaete sordida]